MVADLRPLGKALQGISGRNIAPRTVMFITVSMLQEMEQDIAPDAQAEICVYPSGLTIRVSWNSDLTSVQKQVQ